MLPQSHPHSLPTGRVIVATYAKPKRSLTPSILYFTPPSLTLIFGPFWPSAERASDNPTWIIDPLSVSCVCLCIFLIAFVFKYFSSECLYCGAITHANGRNCDLLRMARHWSHRARFPPTFQKPATQVRDAWGSGVTQRPVHLSPHKQRLRTVGSFLII